VNLILVMTGTVIGLAAAFYGASKPRVKGEPFDKRRKVSIAIILFGLLLVVWGAGLTITGDYTR
jgi:drug/metabolite transporter (DMT)-like permease